MSLIQEALKRQQEELEKKAKQEASPEKTPAETVQPKLRVRPSEADETVSKPAQESLEQREPSPEVPSEPETVSSEKQQQPIWMRIEGLVIGVIGIILLAGLGWAVYHLLIRSRAPEKVTTSVASRVEAGKETQPPVTGKTEIVVSTSTVQHAVSSQAVQTVQTTGKTTETVRVSSESKPSPSTTPTPQTTVVIIPSEQGTTVIPKKIVAWPALKLSGVVGKETYGSAIINSNIVQIGQSIEGVKIVRIVEGGVEVEYQGETKILRVGGSTR
jgi:hypothetical protein